MLSSWLSPQRRPRVPACAQVRRLHVERLEDRTVPTVTGVFNGTTSLVLGPVTATGTAASNQTQPTIAINPLVPTTAYVMADQMSKDQYGATTTDGGNTYTNDKITTTLAAQDGLGDGYRLNASAAYDRFGNLHVVYQFMDNDPKANPFREFIVYARSTDNGATFGDFQIVDFDLVPQFPSPPGPPHDPGYYPDIPDIGYYDKPMITTGPDAATPGDDAVFVTWTDDLGRIRIRGATVSNLGEQIDFSKRVTVGPSTAPLIFDPRQYGINPQGNDYAMPTVGPNGEVLVTWIDTQSGRIMFSQDQQGLANGLLFTAPSVVTNTNTNIGYQLQATDFWQTPKNPPAPPPYIAVDPNFFPDYQGHFYDAVSGISARPMVAVDHSNGPHRGRMYLTYTDAVTPGSTDTDIYLRYSDDSGVTWSNATRVNDDTTKSSQFLGSMSVDDQGNIFIGWYDTRNDRADGLAGDTNTDFYANDEPEFWATASIDGGKTFLPNIKVSKGASYAFRSGSQENFGNYTSMAAFGGSAYAAWADNSTTPGGATPDMTAYTGVISLHASGGETVNLTAKGSGDNNWYIRLDPTGNYLEVYENTTNFNVIPTFTAALSSVHNIVVKGGPGNDVVTVDDANGNPIPAGGLSFDGGGQSGDMLVLQGGATQIDSSDYTPTGPQAGTITTSNIGDITFTGVGRVEDVRPVAKQSLEATGNNDLINLVAGPTVGQTATLEYFLGNTQFTPYDVANKTNLTVNGLDGVDQFNVLASAVPLGTSLLVDGGPPDPSAGGGGNLLFVDPTGTTGASIQGNGIDSGKVTFVSGAPTIQYAHIAQATLQQISGSTGTNPNPPDNSVTGSGSTGTGTHSGTGSGSGSGHGSGSGSGTGSSGGGVAAPRPSPSPVINVMTSGNQEIAVGDVTGDGTPDIVIAVKDGAGALHVFVIDGARGGVVSAFTAFNGAPVSRFQLALIDVTGAGRLDVLVVGAGRRAALPLQVFDGLTGAPLITFG